MLCLDDLADNGHRYPWGKYKPTASIIYRTVSPVWLIAVVLGTYYKNNSLLQMWERFYNGKLELSKIHIHSQFVNKECGV